MPIGRQEVEAYIAEQEARFLATLAPLKTRILETLRSNPDQLYSFMELAELFWTIPIRPEPLEGETQEAYEVRSRVMPKPEPKDTEHPLPTQRDAQLFNATLKMLIKQEKVLVAYSYEGQDYFGIAKEEPVYDGGSCACHS